MDRRQFSLTAGSALAGAGLAWSTAAQAQAKKPELGVHYLALGSPAPTEAPAGKVEVLEFFWYNCPHCNAFEPELAAWLKRMPKNVAFRRVPVAFNANFVPQQRLYFSLEALGLVEKLHAKVFDAIHNQKIKLDDGQAITAWMCKTEWIRRSSWPLTTRFRSKPKLKNRRNCKRLTRSRAFRHWALPGGITPTLRWQVA